MPLSFSDAELTYYSRHLSLGAIGLEGQKKLKNARVLCVGAGGLGCPLLLYLAAAGVGTLGIIDGDTVDYSNLHRQILYTPHDIGILKVSLACEKLSALNPHIQTVPYPFMLTVDNILEIISAYDIIVDCSDNFSTRYLINDACFYLKKPNVQASVSQFEGQCSIFTADHGPCYRCLFDSPPPPLSAIPNCAEAGVLGALPGLLGNLQALEVIKLATGIGVPLIGRLFVINGLSLKIKTLNISKNPECRLCGHSPSLHSLSPIIESCLQTASAHKEIVALTPQALKSLKETNQIFILDVREPYEYEICNLGGYLIPLVDLPKRLGELNSKQPVVVHCKKGPRSQKAAIFLKESGFQEVFYLAGGILAWKAEIEPELAGY